MSEKVSGYIVSRIDDGKMFFLDRNRWWDLGKAQIHKAFVHDRESLTVMFSDIASKKWGTLPETLYPAEWDPDSENATITGAPITFDNFKL